MVKIKQNKTKNKTNTEQTRQSELNQTLRTHVHRVALILSEKTRRAEMPHCRVAYLIVCLGYLLKFLHLTEVFFNSIGLI